MSNARRLIGDEQLGKGVFFVLLSCFILALLSAFVKAASDYTSPQLILFFQFLISFVLILPLALEKKNGGIKSSNYKMHFIRALSGTGASYGLFLAISIIPLTTAVLLVYSAPIWMTAFTWAFFREKITGLMWTGVLIGFIGIGLILHPTASTLNKGIILALVGGILMAIALLTVRVLNKTEPTSRILFYYFGFATAVSFPAFIHTLINWKSIAMIGWIYIICVGLCQASSQILLVVAYRYATPAKLAPYIYSVIAFTAIIDFVVWKQSLHFIELTGMICVIFGGVLALWHSQPAQK